MSRRSGRDALLALAFLGQPRLSSRGSPLPFRGRPRSMALLAYLLLHRESHLTRDALAFALWPDDSEADARANLRRHLHHLGTTLPVSDVPYILFHEDTIRWNPGVDVWFDVDAFERLAADPEELAEAVALYEGDLLPGVYDDWIFPIRDRLRRAFLAALETLMLRSRRDRDFTRAKAYAGAILVHDPWREDTLRQLAAICYEGGDRAGALREIDEFARRLAAEMSVDPMPETLALRARILRGGVVAQARTPVAEARTAATFFPFVGRIGERDQLETAWRRAARSRGDLLFVAGDAGIGKSRLVGELALLAEAQGGRVLRGSTTAPEALPYAAIVEGLRDALPLLAVLAVRPIWLAVLAALLPELSLLRDDLPVVPPLDPQRERLRLFEALASVVTALARERPVLFVLEDIHWAGDATLAALEYLARRSAGLPGLIVATYRTDAGDAHPGLPALRRRLQREGVSQHVHIGGLHADAIAELARTIPGLRARAADIGSEIHAISGGNPLFAGELLRERAESEGGSIAANGLRATLEARIGRLSDDAALVARIASVVGITFEIDLVCEVSGWDENAVLRAIGELLERNLVREAGRARFAFAFTHALIATTIYGSIDTGRRRRWHERVALAIEGSVSDRDSVAGALAAHFDAAGVAHRAWPCYVAAAQRAFAVFANREALTAATRALELVTDDAARYDVLALRERIHGRLGDRDGQRGDIDALAALAPRAARPYAAEADVVWRRAQLARACGDVAGEEALLATFMAAVHVFGDLARDAAGRCAVARNRIAASRYDEANAAAYDALERYRALDDRAGTVEALCLLSEIAVSHGSADGVDAFLAQAQTAAAQLAESAIIARVAMARSMAAINRRQFHAARDSAGEALLRFRELGDREGEAEAQARVASALGMLVQFDAARAEFKSAAEICRSIGARLKLAYLLFNESSLAIQLGLFEAAQASIAAALPIFELPADLRGLAVCRNNLSIIRLHAGDPDEARSIALQALADARAIENPLIEAAVLANLGNAERELREFDAALDHMHAAIDIRHRLGLQATFEELSDLALAQFLSGDRDAGRATADDIMLRAPASTENTVWPHYCFWTAACIYHGGGDGARAKTALELAVTRVREQLASTADDASRAAFLRVASVREVHAAADHGVWPEAFAAAPAPRRPVRAPRPS